MRKGGRRNIFANNLKKLQELIHLRTEGAAVTKLGRHFSCDHTTIIDNLRRYAPHLTKLPAKTKPEVIRPNKQPKDWIWQLWKQVDRLEHSIQKRVAQRPPPAPARKPMKYARLIDAECRDINPGKSYGEYVADRKRRTDPTRKAHLASLKAQYLERVARRGKLVTKSETWKMRSALSRRPAYVEQ